MITNYDPRMLSDAERQAFTLLYQLFQMTVTDVSGVGVPITISK